MPLAIITELEDKLGSLIEKFNSFKKENGELKEELGRKEQEIGELKDENRQMTAAVDLDKSSVAEQKQKLDEAAERIAGLIKRLESIG